ncbi:hypothetical protein ASC90_07565 [Rhizobium sp. Root1220]|nr:hypothetical protein ASC90_07565 [Rhizobium sp. Root1220]
MRRDSELDPGEVTALFTVHFLVTGVAWLCAAPSVYRGWANKSSSETQGTSSTEWTAFSGLMQTRTITVMRFL